jgi:hypothetical protein
MTTDPRTICGDLLIGEPLEICNNIKRSFCVKPVEGIRKEGP